MAGVIASLDGAKLLRHSARCQVRLGPPWASRNEASRHLSADECPKVRTSCLILQSRTVAAAIGCGRLLAIAQAYALNTYALNTWRFM